MHATAKVPKVSVVMPVYNGEMYLREAIDSILRQTFTDFEFIIIDDGSRDSSVHIVRDYSDQRIRLVCNEPNLGVAHSRNRGIRLARGKYIATMDADDVSGTERFAKQVAFLDMHPDYGVVGTWTKIWHGAEKTQRAHRHPTESIVLKYELLFNSYFVNSSTMIRKDVFDLTGLYPTEPSQPYPEDYALWSKVARHFEIANLSEYLHAYREVAASQTRQTPISYRDHVISICTSNLAHALGKVSTDRVINDIAAYIHGAYAGVPTPGQIMEWTRLLFAAADKLSDGNHVPRRRLRRRACGRTTSLLRAYPGQILRAAALIKSNAI